VVWAFPDKNAATNDSNYALVYKWDDGRWAEWDLTTAAPSAAGLSRVVGSVNTGKLERIGAFTGTDTPLLGFFSGHPATGIITTGDLQPKTGARWQINSVRPIITKGQVDTAAAPRTQLNSAVTFGTASAPNADGLCQLRSEGRYQRLRCSISATFSQSLSSSITLTISTWSHFEGIEIDYELEGDR
jgi:hypothetical protein